MDMLHRHVCVLQHTVPYMGNESGPGLHVALVYAWHEILLA